MPEVLTPPVTVNAPDNPVPQLPIPPAPAQQPAPQPQQDQSLPAARPMPAPAAPPPVSAEEKSYSAIGRVAHALMGKSVDYVTDPATGQTKPVVSDRKPGDFARSIVAGALMGMMTGAHEKTFAGGVGAGGAAGLQLNQEADQQKFNRAQQQFKNQQAAKQSQREDDRLQVEKDRLSQEKMYQAATVAHMTWEQIHSDRDSAMRNLEAMTAQQRMNADLQQKMSENGAYPLNVPNNGVKGNAQQLMEDYTKHPERFKAPDGTSLLPVPTYDFSDLSWDEKKGWVNKDGNADSPSNHATWTIYAIPHKAMDEMVSVPGSVLAKEYGMSGLDTTKNYPMPLKEYMSIQLGKNQLDRSDRTEALQQKRLGWQAEHEAAQAELKSLQTQYDAETKALEPDRGKLQELAKKITDVTEDMKDAAYRVANDGKERPRPTKTASPTAQPGAPTLDDIWNSLKALPREEQLKAIASSTRLSPADKEDLMKRANDLVPSKEWMMRPESKQSPI